MNTGLLGAKCEWLGDFMSRISLFVLPLIGAVGMYFLVSIVFPDLNQLVALLIAIVVGWVLRWALGRLQSRT